MQCKYCMCVPRRQAVSLVKQAYDVTNLLFKKIQEHSPVGYCNESFVCVGAPSSIRKESPEQCDMRRRSMSTREEGAILAELRTNYRM